MILDGSFKLSRIGLVIHREKHGLNWDMNIVDENII